MADVSGSLGDLMTNISRTATAHRWGAEILTVRNPQTGMINTAFRAAAQGMATGDRDYSSDSDYAQGMTTILAVLIFAYTAVQEPSTIAAIMDHVMTYWENWIKENPDA